MEKILNVAVVGLGRAGWQIHIPRIMAHKGFKLSGVVDPLDERRKEARRHFGVAAFESLEKLFEQQNPDVVVIVSPTHFHKEQSLLAFRHGADVLCDKPMAVTLEEAREMVEAMHARSRKMMIFQPHRAHVETVALRALLREDLLGPVFMIKRRWSRYRVRVDWQAFARYGGGELNNSGAHFVDQLLYLSASPVKKIHCLRRRVLSRGDAEDFAKIIMETENGMILDVEVNFAAAIAPPAIQVFGERGTMVLDEEHGLWRARYYDKGGADAIRLQEGLAAENRSYMDDQQLPWKEKNYPLSAFSPIDFYDKCYEHFALNQPAFIPPGESLEVMRILDVCKKKTALE